MKIEVEKAVCVTGEFKVENSKTYRIKREIEYTKEELKDDFNNDLNELIESEEDNFIEDAEDKFREDFEKDNIDLGFGDDFELDNMDSYLQD